jgi:hypothetical protein
MVLILAELMRMRIVINKRRDNENHSQKRRDNGNHYQAPNENENHYQGLDENENHFQIRPLLREILNKTP